MEFFIFVYAGLFLAGIIGNGSIVLSVWLGPGAKNRNLLIAALAVADLVVCAVSGPLSAATYATRTWSQNWLPLTKFLQAWPVAASTLSMTTISVDRYLTIKNYRPTGQVARRRHLLIVTGAAVWLVAALLSATQLVTQHPWAKVLALLRVLLVHILPICIVLITHLGVHAKLTALSLTARAKHGELPLPMPLLRRPTHVIIVAGISKQGRDKLQTMEATVEEVPQPPTSTLRSRRRLANSLLWVAAIFSACWLPFIVDQCCREMGAVAAVDVHRGTLLLGHLHSVVSPALYWFMNKEGAQRSCTGFRLPGLYRSASSTNEAALGPFNPKFVRPPPIRRQSSHFLY